MAFEINLKQFQGPLDLLLQLVTKAKIDLKDIFLSEITEQFIHIVQTNVTFDMDNASEFIAMAATLIEIKSKRLLPKPVDPNEEDPEEALIKRLQAYQVLQLLSAQMTELEKAANESFCKLPEEVVFDKMPPELDGLDLENLWQALLAIGQRKKEEPKAFFFEPRAIHRDVYTIQGCIESIQSRLTFGEVPFTELLSDEPSREEIVTVFCALLELLKLGLAHTEQKTILGEMMLVPGARVIEDEYVDEEHGIKRGGDVG